MDIKLVEDGWEVSLPQPENKQVESVQDRLPDQRTVEGASRSTTTYCDTAVQTLPPGNAEAFRIIHGRDPTVQELVSNIGAAAIGRYEAGATADLYDTIIGTPFSISSCVITETDLLDASFQTLAASHRNISIARAKAKASLLVSKYRNAARNAGYEIWFETEDSKIVHAEQWAIRIQFDEQGNAVNKEAYRLSLPNICGEEISLNPSLSENHLRSEDVALENDLNSYQRIEKDIWSRHAAYVNDDYARNDDMDRRTGYKRLNVLRCPSTEFSEPFSRITEECSFPSYQENVELAPSMPGSTLLPTRHRPLLSEDERNRLHLRRIPTLESGNPVGSIEQRAREYRGYLQELQSEDEDPIAVNEIPEKETMSTGSHRIRVLKRLGKKNCGLETDEHEFADKFVVYDPTEAGYQTPTVLPVVLAETPRKRARQNTTWEDADASPKRHRASERDVVTDTLEYRQCADKGQSGVYQDNESMGLGECLQEPGFDDSGHAGIDERPHPTFRTYRDSYRGRSRSSTDLYHDRHKISATANDTARDSHVKRRRKIPRRRILEYEPPHPTNRRTNNTSTAFGALPQPSKYDIRKTEVKARSQNTKNEPKPAQEPEHSSQHTTLDSEIHRVREAKNHFNQRKSKNKKNENKKQAQPTTINFFLFGQTLPRNNTTNPTQRNPPLCAPRAPEEDVYTLARETENRRRETVAANLASSSSSSSALNPAPTLAASSAQTSTKERRREIQRYDARKKFGSRR